VAGVAGKITFLPFWKLNFKNSAICGILKKNIFETEKYSFFLPLLPPKGIAIFTYCIIIQTYRHIKEND